MMVLSPAYGRDYTSKAKVLADWDAHKDFILNDYQLAQRPINKYQIERSSETRVVIRYGKLQKSVVIEVVKP